MAKTLLPFLSVVQLDPQLNNLRLAVAVQARPHRWHGHHCQHGQVQEGGKLLLSTDQTTKLRRGQFFAKKTASAVVKEETVDENHKSSHLMENPSDEIELEKIPEDDRIDIKIGDLFKIKGEYKNNKFKPWSKIEPENEIKVLWSDINTVNNEKGIEEIGEGSTCFEHCFEFWGTWRVKKENITVDVLKDSENWPKGVKITEVKPA